MATLLFACVAGVTSCKKGKESVSSEPTESVSGSEVSGEVSVTISPDSVTVSENEYVIGYEFAASAANWIHSFYEEENREYASAVSLMVLLLILNS